MNSPVPIPDPCFPAVVDNTIAETWFACEGKGMMQYFFHWGPQLNVNLHAGGAFAKGVEVVRRAFYAEGKSDDEAVAEGMLAAYEFYGTFIPPPGSNKTFAAVGRAVADYFSQYPLAEDVVQPFIDSTGKPAIEFNFALPLPILNPDTGLPILYGGRSDMIARYNDSVFVDDEKTTTSLGPSWERQWDMAGQFTGYTWAAREHGYPVAGAIIRGVSFLTHHRFGHAQVVSPRTGYVIDFWYEQLLLKVQRMVDAWVEFKKRHTVQGLALPRDAFMWSHGAACKSYGGCSFIPVCQSPQPDKVLAIYFTKRKWDPLHIAEDV